MLPVENASPIVLLEDFEFERGLLLFGAIQGWRAITVILCARQNIKIGNVIVDPTEKANDVLIISDHKGVAILHDHRKFQKVIGHTANRQTGVRSGERFDE